MLLLPRLVCFLLAGVSCSFAAGGGRGPGVPVSLRTASLPTKVAAAAAVAGLAAAGKVLQDGPVFAEDVDMTGKTVVITGGNTGLGKEAAVKLASLGATVILACRNPAAASAACDEVRRRSGDRGQVSSVDLDLASLRSVEQCVDALKTKCESIDVLMNNAGVMALPQRETTKDGFERQLGINHLGHFALTGLLLKTGLLGKKRSPSRIINVSSTAHLLGDLEKARSQGDLLLAEPNAYAPWQAYGNSKLANVLFTRELANRLKSNSNVVTFSLHPGACRTELGRYIVDPSSIPKFLYPVVGVAALPLVYFTKVRCVSSLSHLHVLTRMWFDAVLGTRSTNANIFGSDQQVGPRGQLRRVLRQQCTNGYL